MVNILAPEYMAMILKKNRRFWVFHDVVLVAILISAMILVISILGLLVAEGYGDTTDNKVANKVS